MGNIYHVYQLKPKVVYTGAFLRVRKDKEIIFSEKYPLINQVHQKTSVLGIFENTFIMNSHDGKVRKDEYVGKDTIIDFEKPGIYVSIHSGSKYGFGRDFNEFLSIMSLYLEDALFYVTQDATISRYEIINGELHYNSNNDFGRWNYFIEEYVADTYSSSKQLVAELYVEETYEMIRRYDRHIEDGEDPEDFFYEAEDYKDLLNKITNYKSHIETEEFKKLEDWLKTQMNE
ncbi:hypothetical protein [Chryseobacterium sp. Mn2064]|uniref:hypothetical protein n=1 Tax=Chryseobacterium sp. Mn2064 TaxID=3395263 RepID=UPI003BE581D2